MYEVEFPNAIGGAYSVTMTEGEFSDFMRPLQMRCGNTYKTLADGRQVLIERRGKQVIWRYIHTLSTLTKDVA